MKTLLSLFDLSGEWSDPFAAGGWDVIQWDWELSKEMDIMNLGSAETLLTELDWQIDGILAACPCTDFASSGSRWFVQKDLSGITDYSVSLVMQTLNIIDLFRPTDPDFYAEGGTFFWAIENPVGRIGSLCRLGKPAITFHPWEFAGWIEIDDSKRHHLDAIRQKKGIGVTKEEADLILECGAYTKRTCLWGEFNTSLIRKPIAPVMGNSWGTPLMRLGGKSGKTKEVRSRTPAGFAKAFFEANQHYKPTEQGQLFYH